MMSCWSYESSNRPTFTKCLAELLNLQDKLEHSPFTAVHNGHYVGAPLYRKFCLIYYNPTRTIVDYLFENSCTIGLLSLPLHFYSLTSSISS